MIIRKIALTFPWIFVITLTFPIVWNQKLSSLAPKIAFKIPLRKRKKKKKAFINTNFFIIERLWIII